MIDKAVALIKQGHDITIEPPQIQTNWLIGMGQSLEESEKIEDGIIIFQGKILYEVWSIWEANRNQDGRYLSQEATSPWQYDFYNWAKAYTKRRAKREQAEDTIDNKIRVYKNWSQMIEPPQTVTIPKRDEYGLMTGETEEVEFRFEDCDYGKLLVATVQAREGKMTPEAWIALRDPFATTNKLKEKLGIITPPPNDDFYLEEREGIIYGCQNGTRVPVMQVLWENDDNELFSRALCHILRASGLRVPIGYQK